LVAIAFESRHVRTDDRFRAAHRHLRGLQLIGFYLRQRIDPASCRQDYSRPEVGSASPSRSASMMRRS
jgi:hypothetical protein